jgi:redox-sensing transcriptional repressor
VVIGAGNLGKALVRSPMFEKRGIEILAMFDVSKDVIGRNIGGAIVLDMNMLEDYIKDFKVDIAILTLPKEVAGEVAQTIAKTKIKGIWNFTGKEIELGESVIVENVHIGDSLMTLCYEIGKNDKNEKE